MKRFLFFLLWPLVWIYAPLTRRVRVVILHENNFLAVKNSFGPGIWQLPGGGIKLHESVLSAAAREVKEELGINLVKTSELHKDIRVVKQFGLLMRYHFVYAPIDKKTKFVKSSELSNATWLPISTSERLAKEVSVGLRLVRQQG